MENTRNQDGIGEKELLVASFGTSWRGTRERTIGAIEETLERTLPDYAVRRGFTSQRIVQRLAREGVCVDTLDMALARAVKNGVRRLAIQPTHLICGIEYYKVVAAADRYASAFERIAVGKPLLSSDEDMRAVIRAVTDASGIYDDGETAVCLMGHGTEAAANTIYARLQEELTAAGYSDYYVGTVEAEPTLQDLLAAVRTGSYRRVVLEPFMLVAGDHAENDMAGDQEDSWKRTFEREGYETVCLLRGLGELPAVRELFVRHARAVVDCVEG